MQYIALMCNVGRETSLRAVSGALTDALVTLLLTSTMKLCVLTVRRLPSCRLCLRGESEGTVQWERLLEARPRKKLALVRDMIYSLPFLL